MATSTFCTQMPDKDDIIDLLDDFSIELTPKIALSHQDLRSLLKKGQRIYITCLPESSIAHTLEACMHLLKQGFKVIPHIAARSIESDDQLGAVLKRLQQLNIKEVLLIAGVQKIPKGPYSSVRDLLLAYDFASYGITHLSFAGHPEGSLDISLQALMQAAQFKQNYVQTHQLSGSLTTQFCFEAQPIIHWLELLHQNNIQLPVYIGVAGLASTTTLLNYAKACGVGSSINYLLRHGASVKHLLHLRTPDKLIFQLASYKKQQRETTSLSRLHFYPFGGLSETMNWLNTICAGHFTMIKNGLHVG